MGLKAQFLVREGNEFYWVAGSCRDYGFTLAFSVGLVAIGGRILDDCELIREL